MSPPSRRALLAALGTSTASVLAGCTAPGTKSIGPPPVDGIEGHPVFAADGVTLPDNPAVTTVDSVAAADVAVFPASDSAIDGVTAALEADTVTAVSGRDSQHTLMQACARDSRSYGFASDGWEPDTRVVAADPHDSHLDTHVFVGAEIPRDLPWALGEIFEPAVGDCPPADVGPSESTLLGRSRIRGRNQVAGFDRWDRVAVGSNDGESTVTTDVRATILAGSEVAGDDRYRADQLRTSVEFDQSVTAAARSKSDAGVDLRTGGGERETRTTFVPTDEATRRTFTGCQRSVVTAPTNGWPFSYIGNVRFRWRDPRLLGDEEYHHHTPGASVWYRAGGAELQNE